MNSSFKPSVEPTALFTAFLAALSNDPDALRAWERNGWTPTKWTQVVTRASVQAVASTFRNGQSASHHIAAKGSPDIYGQREYFGLDVVVYRDDWSAPVLTVELENGPGPDIQYACWKLLCVDAVVRVLICYVDPAREYEQYPIDLEALRRLLSEVMQAHPRKTIALFIGSWAGDPRGPDGWREVYSLGSLP